MLCSRAWKCKAGWNLVVLSSPGRGHRANCQIEQLALSIDVGLHALARNVLQIDRWTVRGARLPALGPVGHLAGGGFDELTLQVDIGLEGFASQAEKIRHR